MTWQQSVGAVLDRFEFTAPVELDDIVAFRAAIQVEVPTASRCEVYHRHRDVVVNVIVDGAAFTRTMQVT